MGNDGFGKFVCFLVCIAFGFYVYMAHKAVQKQEAVLYSAYSRGTIALDEYLARKDRISVFDMLFYPKQVFESGF